MVQSSGTQPTLSECQLLSWFITCGPMGKTVGTVMGGGAMGPGVVGIPKAEPERGPLLQQWGCSGGCGGQQKHRLFPLWSHSG